jgi:hypothetical protein
MNIIERYSNPTRYDIAAYGQLCIHGDKYFIQVSKNPDIANWLELGVFLELCYRKSILNDDFLAQCLSMYEGESSSINDSCKQETI